MLKNRSLSLKTSTIGTGGILVLCSNLIFVGSKWSFCSSLKSTTSLWPMRISWFTAGFSNHQIRARRQARHQIKINLILGDPWNRNRARFRPWLRWEIASFNSKTNLLMQGWLWKMMFLSVKFTPKPTSEREWRRNRKGQSKWISRLVGEFSGLWIFAEPFGIQPRIED